MSLSLWDRARAAVYAAQRTFADPTVLETPTPGSSRSSVYEERWSYATSSAFDNIAAWAARASKYRLYKYTRLIYNPVGRLNEFYGSQVYPGFLPQGDMPIPGGAREAIPFVPGVDPAVEEGARQLWQWSNWQIMKDVMVEFAAAVGDCLVELVDDPSRGKIAFRPWWPGLVVELSLDWYGNIRVYAIAYQAYDRVLKKTYTFKQRVTKETFETFYDDVPWSPDPDVPPVQPNPYGFVPAVWVQHRSIGTTYGQPAIRGTSKIDELNSLVSRVHDHIGVRMKSPLGIAGKFDANGFKTHKKGGEDGDTVFLISLPDGATGVPLSGNIEPEQALGHITNLIKEIEADNPELTAWNQLRSMGEVSGVAIERALGDTQGRLYRAQASYDLATVKMIQMGIAMAGHRLASGDWEGTPAQRKFEGFGLESYANGDLDCAIAPRPLVPPTSKELYETQQARYDALAAAQDAGIPAEVAMVDLDWSKEDAARITKESAEAIARARTLAESDVDKDGNPPPEQ